ncbi:MAG: cobyrinic acid a,c-diamide synthase [Mycobacteriales bacterium]
MSRRIALPGADELFRSTGDSAPRPDQSAPAAPQAPAPEPRATTATLSIAPEPVADLSAPQEAAPDAVSAEDDLEIASHAVRPAARRRSRAVSERRPSGRERHDEKITVYVSADELMDLEHARLALRGDHGLPVDRGRVVREALAVVLADFEAKGEASILVRRLRGR